MTTKKSNIRSMRFSDEVVRIIEAQAGDNFTAKFEALVTRCVWELPRKQQELKEIQKQIENERKNLRIIREKKAKLAQNLSNLEYSSERIIQEIERSLKTLEDM